jgi:hypothetical protein
MPASESQPAPAKRKKALHYGLRFHHFGLAVKQPEMAMNFLAGLGYRIGPTYRDTEQEVHLMLATRRGMPAVEVIYPTEKPGPLDSILKSKDSMVYHLCYTSENRSESLRLLKAQNNRVFLLSSPRPAILFGGRKVSFYVIAGFGVIEILEPRQTKKS